MFQKSSIAFPASNHGLMLRGWLYKPNQHRTAYPAIIMLPGFSALKEHGLHDYASVFADAGFVVLVYDHRNFGESDTDTLSRHCVPPSPINGRGESREAMTTERRGVPCGRPGHREAMTPERRGVPCGRPGHREAMTTMALEVDPWLQIQDLHAAIAYLQTRPDILIDHIGVWGSSFAGGHVLVAATENPSIKAVVAQVPFVRGHHASLQTQKPEKWQALQQLYLADKEARARGEPPKMTPVVTNDPSQPAIMKQEDAYTFFTSVPTWPNQVTFHSIENSGNYNPIDCVSKLVTPTLFIVADGDTVNLTALALEAYEKISAPKDLLMIPGEHFSPHLDAFTECSEAALAWFKRYLM